jgi:hypothetical protein
MGFQVFTNKIEIRKSRNKPCSFLLSVWGYKDDIFAGLAHEFDPCKMIYPYTI